MRPFLLAAVLAGLALAPPQAASAQSAPPASTWSNQGWDTASSREGLLGGFHWNFESTDPRQSAMRALVEKVRKVAWEFFPFALIVGLIVEAFGRAPGQGRDFSAVVWRAVLAMFLLSFYVPIFNGLIVDVFDPLADRVTPTSGMGEFLDNAARAAQGMPGSGSASTQAGVAGLASKVGGLFYDSLVAFLLLVAEGLVIVIAKLGKILAALLFCIGPLAIVAAIPRPSSTGTRWFGHFVTVLSWPVFTGLLLSIMVAMGREGAATGGYFAAVVASLLMGAIALATPKLAAQVVGGTLENLMSAGVRSAKDVHRDAVGAAMHAGSVATHTADGVRAAAEVVRPTPMTIDPDLLARAGNIASNPPGGPTRP